MSISALVVALTVAQATIGSAHPDVAFNSLMAGNDQAAAEWIEANSRLDSEDPARLINLGVALARQGEVARARALFERAAKSDERFDLETSSGAWVDSRALALRALAALDRTKSAGDVRTAMR